MVISPKLLNTTGQLTVLTEYVFLFLPLGDDEQSTQMLSSWEDERVSELTNNSFVAIKVDAKRLEGLDIVH